MPTRLADYVAEVLSVRGIKDVFLVTGGGAMHLNDAFGRRSELRVICCHHEQSCALAAESYYRLTNRLAAVNVTTGPGGTNAITGVYSAYVDSIGMLVISGQSKWETLVRSTQLPLRQLGDQEVDIIAMVKGITKYAEIIQDPSTIRYHLEKAIFLATSGRPGPVWIDIPVNVQSAMIEPLTLQGYSPLEDQLVFSEREVEVQASRVIQKLQEAKRPVIYAGTGVRLSGQHKNLLLLLEKIGVPVVTAWNSNDLVPDEHPCYAGRPGSVGNRAGNFAVQNSDLLLILGCRLNIRLISYNWENFAPRSYKIWVDIDPAELAKPTVKPDWGIHSDLSLFIPSLLRCAVESRGAHSLWRDVCKRWLKDYPVVLPSFWQDSKNVNPYCFMDRLFEQTNEDEILVTADGTACVTAFQVAKIKSNTRLYHNSGSAPMGYDLPAAIGAAFASGLKQRIICLAGDGSIMMNLQELQTIKHFRLPIKIFVLNNQGYHSIRQTQQSFFRDNIVGCGTESGLSFPSWSQIAAAFEMPFFKCDEHSTLDAVIAKTLGVDGPSLCEVVLDLTQTFAPKLSSRKLEDGRMVTSSLEDMAPFLPREELSANMISVRPEN